MMDFSLFLFDIRHRAANENCRDIGSSMFNGPCQLHGSAGFISAADEALLTPTGYVNAGVTGIPLPHGLRPPPPPPLSDPPCSADHCLMNPGLTCPDVYMALEGVQFLAEHTRREQYTIRVKRLPTLSLSLNIYIYIYYNDI